MVLNCIWRFTRNGFILILRLVKLNNINHIWILYKYICKLHFQYVTSNQKNYNSCRKMTSERLITCWCTIDCDTNKRQWRQIWKWNKRLVGFMSEQSEHRPKWRTYLSVRALAADAGAATHDPAESVGTSAPPPVVCPCAPLRWHLSAGSRANFALSQQRNDYSHWNGK